MAALTSGYNSYQGIIDWVSSSSANGGKGVSKHSDTATTATKLGTTTVGGTAKPIYLNAGAPTAFSSTIGSNTKPIYMNAGVLTAFTGNLGSGTQPLYISSGALTASSSTVGSSTKPVYLNAGTVTALSAPSGSADGKPLYSNSGALTLCTKVGVPNSNSLPVYIPVGQPSGTVSDGAIWIES